MQTIRDRSSLRFSVEHLQNTPSPQARIIATVLVEGEVCGGPIVIASGPQADIEDFYHARIDMAELRRRLFGDAVTAEVMEQG